MVFENQLPQPAHWCTPNSRFKEFLRTAPYQLMVINTDVSMSSSLSHPGKGPDRTRLSARAFPSFEKITRGPEHVRTHPAAPFEKGRVPPSSNSRTNVGGMPPWPTSSNPDLSINAVAALMGFTDPSAFHRSFKKWTDMTPGELQATGA